MATAPQAHMFVREMGLRPRLVLYLLACLILMGLDARFNTLHFLRSGIVSVLHPVQAGLAKPFHYLEEAFAFFAVHGELVRENARLRETGRRQGHALQAQDMLRAENAHLRGLLGLPKPAGFAGQPVEIVQALSNPFARKVVIGSGSLQGLAAGWPVVDERGLVGQVTRVFPASSEVTLITSREQAVPVQVLRSGLRLIVSGFGQDRLLEVRYLDMHADLLAGDELVTSGLDGVYPPGIPVARVLRTEPPRHTPFARALCLPVAGVGRQRQLMVLQREPAAAAASATPSATAGAPPAVAGTPPADRP